MTAMRYIFFLPLFLFSLVFFSFFAQRGCHHPHLLCVSLSLCIPLSRSLSLCVCVCVCIGKISFTSLCLFFRVPLAYSFFFPLFFSFVIVCCAPSWGWWWWW